MQPLVSRRIWRRCTTSGMTVIRQLCLLPQNPWSRRCVSGRRRRCSTTREVDTIADPCSWRDRPWDRQRGHFWSASPTSRPTRRRSGPTSDVWLAGPGRPLIERAASPRRGYRNCRRGDWAERLAAATSRGPSARLPLAQCSRWSWAGAGAPMRARRRADPQSVRCRLLSQGARRRCGAEARWRGT
jgi:hypothetical protein